MLKLASLLVGALVTVGTLSVTARADERIGAFVIFDDIPDAILLDGKIEINAPLELRRALQQRPEARILVLGSPGGLISSALIVADDVHRLGLSTTIPDGFGCYSACSFVFLAGKERLVEGELGVHQMWSERPDPNSLQASVSDILEVLEKFDTPTAVITRMFRTPSEDMYVFSKKEIEDLGINRLGETVLSGPGIASIEPPASSTAPTEKTEDRVPSPPAKQSFGARLALYGGLDFYGADIFKGRVANAVECATSCLGDNQCVAFTFNANPSLAKGPNCFLKSGVDRLEAYKDAFSGLFLGEEEEGAPIFEVGAIDPTVDVRKGIDYPGNDLFAAPLRTADTPGECRMACVDNNACEAFSFAARQKQCWLKAAVGAPTEAPNVTSGVKRRMTFQPIDVLSLEE